MVLLYPYQVNRQAIELLYTQKILGLTAEDKIILKKKSEGYEDIGIGEYLVDGHLDYLYPLLKSYDSKLRELRESSKMNTTIVDDLRKRTKQLVKENYNLREKLAAKTFEKKKKNDNVEAILESLEKEALKEENISYQEELEYLYGVLDDLVAQKSSLETRLNVWNKHENILTTATTAEERFIEFEGEIDRLTRQLSDSHNNELMSERHIKELELALHETEGERMKLARKCEVLEKNNKEIVAGRIDIAKWPEQEIQELKNSLSDSRASEKQFKERVIELEEMLTAKQSDGIDTEKSLITTKKELNEYKERVRILEEARFNLENTINLLKDKLQETDSRMSAVRGVEATQQYHQQHIEEQRKQMIDTHNRELKEIRENFGKMLEMGEKKRQAEINTLKEKQSELIRAKERAELDSAVLEKKILSQKKELEGYKHLALVSKEKDENIKDLRIELNKKAEELLRVSKRLENVERLSKMKESMMTAASNEEHSKAEFDSLKQKNHSLVKEIEKLRKRISQVVDEQQGIRLKERALAESDRIAREEQWSSKYKAIEERLYSIESDRKEKITKLSDTIKNHEELAEKIKGELYNTINHYDRTVRIKEEENVRLKNQLSQLKTMIADPDSDSQF